MAIIRDLYKVENNKLHDAILLTELIGTIIVAMFLCYMIF